MENPKPHVFFSIERTKMRNLLLLLQITFGYQKKVIEEAYKDEPELESEKNRIIEDLKRSLRYELPSGHLWFPS